MKAQQGLKPAMHEGLRGPGLRGRPLPEEVRHRAEALFGEDFSGVRIHVSPEARQMGARAFTSGMNIYLAPGEWNPRTERGLQLLGHELAHVVQQRSGRAHNPYNYGVAVVQDADLEAEADRMGWALARGPSKSALEVPEKCHDSSLGVQDEPALGHINPRQLNGLEAPSVQLKAKDKLVVTTGKKYKKKAKERAEASQVEQTLDEQIRHWVEDYGHALDRHSGLTTVQLDARNLPLATTFETDDDLFEGAKAVIVANEAKLNSWYMNTDETRIALWAYRPEECTVRGRRKLARPQWHQYQHPMPPHPGFEDVDEEELIYVIGIFDRDSWSGSPKGLVTCFPSDTKPT
ncbi:DUF4157 domain-containing protein [Vitiosangium sp. GDMCC 1.1324]|uniref:eCIS core domain-containing protein n=1 Tax=Vitiosangium sp. (strain GDMCC 1.1324) TaxID=2138576 RepID=UPI00130EEE3C|nr:DUF4157 domain-containing protein [Vitiosangium sp. GDMCC 1.1324]